MPFASPPRFLNPNLKRAICNNRVIRSSASPRRWMSKDGCLPEKQSAPQDRNTVRQTLLSILRETAQPVAVITAFMDPLSSSASSHPHNSSQSDHSMYHGATLSSFTSVSMHPHPLVAFALRIPSRMATSLKVHHRHHRRTNSPHFMINILSALQEPVAHAFSRADLHPFPFSSVPFSLSGEGLPVLQGSLGALSCKMIRSWSLYDMEELEAGKEAPEEWTGEGQTSELFIAKVLRAENLTHPETTQDDAMQTLPLVYHRRSFCTTSVRSPSADSGLTPPSDPEAKKSDTD